MNVHKLVLVAVKASNEIPRAALVWALTHVTQPGDCIKLLVVIPGGHSSSHRIWGFPKLTTDCTSSHARSLTGTTMDQKSDIADSWSQLMLQLNDVYDPEKVKVSLKIVSSSPHGIVAAEAKRAQSNWVILDKGLKHEAKRCLEDLQCNVVLMKKSQAKVLQLNLAASPSLEPYLLPTGEFEESRSSETAKGEEIEEMIKGPFVTPVSSPDRDSLLTGTDFGNSSISSSDRGASPFILPGHIWNFKKGYPFISQEKEKFCESDSDTESEKTCSSFQPWIGENFNGFSEFSKNLSLKKPNGSSLTSTPSHSSLSTYDFLLDKLSSLNQTPDNRNLNYKNDLNSCKSLREAISFPKIGPSAPPPLCSTCQHKGPIFGTPPKWFTYTELDLATDGFSQENFLAEGGYGSVHRGVLPNGQVVAVKQHKFASSQGDQEFCSEVEVLSCAQHRNVVMLIGFCIEDGRRILVYEYICNGSLDAHLYGRGNRDRLEWSARQRIAVGAARGLRYLHEECRVGCIVHRDMRPNNILLTHDFEPMVGDFGLARWQPNGDQGVETRIIGTFGYLAPEYAQSGQITELADVYSFGVVLVELLTGRKAIDINRPKGQQCLTEWARPLLEKQAIDELIDPFLRGCYQEQEASSMLKCASKCIERDPSLRPRMSKVLRMLEGS